mgnify:CR=1 FL=1
MDDTKDTKDIKETGEAASVLSADEQMIQDGFNALLNDYLKSNHRVRSNESRKLLISPIKRTPE